MDRLLRLTIRSGRNLQPFNVAGYIAAGHASVTPPLVLDRLNSA
jgi:hypothetical protein